MFESGRIIEECEGDCLAVLQACEDECAWRDDSEGDNGATIYYFWDNSNIAHRGSWYESRQIDGQLLEGHIDV